MCWIPEHSKRVKNTSSQLEVFLSLELKKMSNLKEKSLMLIMVNLLLILKNATIIWSRLWNIVPMKIRKKWLKNIFNITKLDLLTLIKILKDFGLKIRVQLLRAIWDGLKLTSILKTSEHISKVGLLSLIKRNLQNFKL